MGSGTNIENKVRKITHDDGDCPLLLPIPPECMTVILNAFLLTRNLDPCPSQLLNVNVGLGNMVVLGYEERSQV
jgi:hypothetical protein